MSFVGRLSHNLQLASSSGSTALTVNLHTGLGVSFPLDPDLNPQTLAAGMHSTASS